MGSEEEISYVFAQGTLESSKFTQLEHIGFVDSVVFECWRSDCS